VHPLMQGLAVSATHGLYLHRVEALVFRSLSENSSTREDTQKLGRTAAEVLEHRTTGLSRNAEGPLDAPFLLVCLDRILWMGAPN
jgi:hypothetical protein